MVFKFSYYRSIIQSNKLNTFSFFKVALVGAILFINSQIVFGQNISSQEISPFDLNNNGIIDRMEIEVIVNSNVTLPAGEYFFNNLVINNDVAVTVESDINSSNSFKGVKINAVNLTINNGAILNADGDKYGIFNDTDVDQDYRIGASYGGVSYGGSPTKIYGSATKPTDLGRAGYYEGGRALWLVVTESLVNNGVMSANGGPSGSGGSIYVATKNLSGSGIFKADGGRLFASGFFKSPGGGGRIAIYYETKTFSGQVQAKGGCGSYDSWTLSCASDGTVGFFDTQNNNLQADSFWRFQKNDSPLKFNNIDLRNGAKVQVADGAIFSANNLIIDNVSELYFIGSSTISVPNVSLSGGSIMVLSGEGSIIVNDLNIYGTSTVTVSNEKILFLDLLNLKIDEGSSVSADGKGYSFGQGPGAPSEEIYQAGASYGGVGWGNIPSSTYGSSTSPTDFGSGGLGYSPLGGGAIRLNIRGDLLNNGIISSNGDNTSSGGSIYVTAKNILGGGIFEADGGRNHCPNVCINAGGGGRIAIYYENYFFGGEVHARGGMNCYYGCTRLSGNGTVVIKKLDQSNYCADKCFSNVLFLPGFQASRLYKKKSILGLPIEDQLWEPNNKSDVKELYLDESGSSIKAGIYTNDVISETNTPVYSGLAGQNIYKSFINMMDGLMEEKVIKKWETYAYDWRYGVDDIVENGVDYRTGNKSLITTLENLISSSNTGKVTIIAHSNGGLLAKALLAKLQEMKDDGLNDLIDKVDVVVLVAVPQIGTAKAVPSILHGYDQKMLLNLLMDQEHARELGKSMISAYGLLPSREYINRVDISPITFKDNLVPSGITTNYINKYGNIIDSYFEYKSFLFGNEGRINPASYDTNNPIKLSQNIFSKAESLHDVIDHWMPPSNIKLVEIAGWGLDTVASMEYYPKLTGCMGGSVGCLSPYTLDVKPKFTVDGDKTVVGPSAHYSVGEKWWVNLPAHNREIRRLRRNREHKDILEVDQLNNLIKSLITNKEFVSDLVVTQTEPIDNLNRLRISIHSPVSIGSYDKEGNFTGKICDDSFDFCYIQQDISNSSYHEFGEGKYINLPEEELEKVMLQGTDTGTFTFESVQVLPSGENITSVFKDIPVTTQTQGEMVLDSDTKLPKLMLDVTGDGVFDFVLNPQDDFDPVIFLQIMKKTINSFDITQKIKDTLSKRIDGIIKLIQKGKILKVELKVDKFKAVLEREINKPAPKKIKQQKLSNTDAEILIDMLEKLLNNLDK